MPMEKTYTYKNANIQDAFHKIKNINIMKDLTVLSVAIFNDETSAEQDENAINVDKYVIEGSDHSQYFFEPNMTENIIARAELYLREKIVYYADAVQI